MEENHSTAAAQNAACQPPDSETDPGQSISALLAEFRKYGFDLSAEFLRDWYINKHFHPFFNEFQYRYLRYQRKDKCPHASKILANLEFKEGNGKSHYTDRYSNRLENCKGWASIDWYSYIVANVELVNSLYKGGIFYGKTEFTQRKERWMLVYQAVRKAIHSTAVGKDLVSAGIQGDFLVLPKETISRALQDNRPGVTLIWGNYQHPTHGVPKDGPQLPPNGFGLEIKDAYNIHTLAALRNEAKTVWGLQNFNPKLTIGEMYTVQSTPDLHQPVKLNLGQVEWQQKLRRMLPGNSKRVYIIINTVKEIGKPEWASTISSNLESVESVLDLPIPAQGHGLDTAESEEEIVKTYVTENLEFDGKWSSDYELIHGKDVEKLKGSPRPYLRDFNSRGHQYHLLFDLTKTKYGYAMADATLKEHCIAQFNSEDEAKLGLLWQEELEKSGLTADEIDAKASFVEEAATIGNVQLAASQENARVKFNLYQSWMDNVECQEGSLEDSLEVLGMERTWLHLSGTTIHLTLYPHQVVGAAWLLMMWDERDFAILADTVSTGKTITFLAGIQASLNHRAKSRSTKSYPLRFGRPKPTLVIVPENLLKQWVSTILEYFEEMTVYIYCSGWTGSIEDESLVVLPKNVILTQDHPLFDGQTERNASSIILTTPKYFSHRHGPSAQAKWRARENTAFNQKKDTHLDDEIIPFQQKRVAHLINESRNARSFDLPAYEDLDEDWPGNLNGCVGHLCLDEAQFARGGTTTMIGKAIQWLEPNDMTAITASPIVRDVNDLFGLKQIAELSGDESPWNSETLEFYQVNRWFNPFIVPDYHHAVDLRYTAHALKRFVVPLGNMLEAQGHRVRKFYEPCLLKRTYESRIPSVDVISIRDFLPIMDKKVYTVNFTKDELADHMMFHNLALGALCKPKEGSDGAGNDGAEFMIDACQLRVLIHLTTSTKLYYLSKENFNSLPKYRRDPDFTLSTLTILISLNHRTLNLPGVGFDCILLWWTAGSPKLRIISWIVAELVVKKKEKLLIFTSTPWQQFLIYLFLKVVLGRNVCTFDSGLKPEEREALAQSFSTDPDCPKVLVCSYYVPLPRMNYHQNCRNILLESPPPSDSVELRTLNTVYKVGQRRNIRVMKLILNNSWNSWTEANAASNGAQALEAILPEDFQAAEEKLDVALDVDVHDE